MPGKKWDEQDAAFFGESATSDSSKKLSTDEELAKKLQEQYLDEKKASEETDRDLAKRIQQQDSQSSDTNGGSSSNRGFLGQAGSRLMSFTRRKKQEDEDAALARAIHEEEEQGRAHSGGQSSSSNPSSPTPSFINRTPNHTGERRSGGHSLIPRCAICHSMVIVPISALGNLYHPECFKCIGCHATIRENERFAYTQGDDGRKHPLHRQCYAELYGLKCTVCSATMQSDANGRVSYMKHPFFEGEYMCPKHTQEACRRCTGCFRFEPIATPFADLNDENRCVCDACLRSVIVDSDDAKPLWAKVIQFLENNLKLPIWPGMKDIPILIVGHNALNDQMMNSTGRHGGSSQIMTRGLCLSEHQRGVNFMLPHMRFDRKRSSFLPSVTATSTSSNSKSDNNGYTYFQIPDASTSNPNSNVTAILCLSGLPADLTASILAHEATHAWMKLNPHFHVSKPIPPQVEEGCCQLIAMLFLTDGLGCASARESSGNVSGHGSGNGDGNGPSDQKLRQYFKFSIETASDDTYGEGYRKAARAYAEIGIEALMSHVVNYQEFPTV